MIYKGVAVSPGVVVGVVRRIEPIFAAGGNQRIDDARAVSDEIAAFDAARAAAAAELETIIAKVRGQVGDDEAAIFLAHRELVDDPGLARKVRELVESERLTALSALFKVLQEYVAKFTTIDNDYFRERLADIRDVMTRIGGHLVGAAGAPPEAPLPAGEPVVLVSHELLPSQAIGLGDLEIAGIVTEIGGSTSHAAILSRSRGIPAVSGVNIVSEARTGDAIVVDGREGLVILNPGAETLAAYRKLQREFVRIKETLVSNRDLPAATRDGTRFELLANVNNASDVSSANEVGADGVGLFRTEYLFLAHHDVPDEEEQYRRYREIVDAADGRPVTIRTLDLGGDKRVPYLGQRNEPNPFLGWRSIRLMTEHPRLFEQQIRAILRAGAGARGKVQMLFPMITHLGELRQINKMVADQRARLKAERIPFGEHIRTGVMIEVPAAAVCVESIVRETDFVSIGSNDLVQYLVAADRDNPKVASLCDPLNPAVFKILNDVVQACSRIGTPLTVCGEMAGQPRAVLVLAGLGVRKFSMSPAFIPTIKALLSNVAIADAERFAHHVLQLKTAEEIRSYLTERIRGVSKDLGLLDFS